jgi:hypothetical protein
MRRLGFAQRNGARVPNLVGRICASRTMSSCTSWCGRQALATDNGALYSRIFVGTSCGLSPSSIFVSSHGVASDRSLRNPKLDIVSYFPLPDRLSLRRAKC